MRSCATNSDLEPHPGVNPRSPSLPQPYRRIASPPMPTKQEANAAAQQELQRVVRAHAAHAPSATADADLLRAIRGFMSNR